jgi:hypothetical protein
MTKEIIVQRLSIIKHLYKTGVEQARLPEVIAFTSILTFHDALDMFLQLVAQKQGITKRGKIFLMGYFDIIHDLQHKASINKINLRRNSIKHNGQIPANIEIQESQTITYLFLEEHTRKIFNIEFEAISLVDLISYDAVRKSLQIAQTFIDKKNRKGAVINIAIAFFQLLSIDKSVKINSKRFLHDHNYQISHLLLPRLAPVIAKISNRQGEIEAEKFDKSLKRTLDKFNENFKRLEDTLKILFLGIDYRKWTEFRMITPWVNFDGQEYQVYGVEEELLTDSSIKFLQDFVLESALKMQQLQAPVI